MTAAFDDVFALAAELRRREPSDKVTFTHVPVVVEPSEALALVRASSLGPLLLDEGAVLNTPGTDWYVPVLPVRSDPAALTDVTVTASTWESAAELTLRMVYVEGEAKAKEELRLYAAAGRAPSLSRWSFDHQRFQTGYEGERRQEVEPTDTQVEDVLALVRRLTGSET